MDALVTRSHDQEVGLPQSTVDMAEQEVDDMIDRALLVGDPQVALDYGYSLIKTAHMRGVQLARLLYLLQEKWDSFQTDDTVEDAVFKSMGVSQSKFDIYTRMYRYVLKDHPELAGKPIGGLQAIIAAARDGDFSDEDWAALALAHDKAAMIEIRRNARGILTKGHARVTISWDRDGFVWAHKENEESEALGQLNHKPATEHGIIAIDRLMDDRVFRR